MNYDLLFYFWLCFWSSLYLQSTFLFLKYKIMDIIVKKYEKLVLWTQK